MKRSERLVRLARSLANKRRRFFAKKGPGKGDRDTAAFMSDLRTRAKALFGHDFSEKKLSGDAGHRVDFYFPSEKTIVELALGLRNPTSEYERDVFKALMARDRGGRVRNLLFISKPGAVKRFQQPGLQAIAAWAKRVHGLKIEVQELKESG